MRVFFLFSYEFIKKDFVRLYFNNTKKIEIMITNVVLSERAGKKFVTFFTCEEKAKQNSLDTTRFFNKSLLTINEFLNLKNVVFDLGNKSFKSVKGLIKAEIQHVKDNYPLDLKHYSNLI